MDLSRISLLDDARAGEPGAPRHTALRLAAARLGDRLREGPSVVRAEVLPLGSVLMAPHDACAALRSASPLVRVRRRALLVTVMDGARVLRVLVDPAEPDAWRRTPAGTVIASAHPVAARAADPGPRIEDALARIGVLPEEIDVVVLTHLFAASLDRLVGDGERTGALPSATWLLPAADYASRVAPHPDARAMLSRGGLDGLDASRIVRVARDVEIAPGLALVRTPGLTEGHLTVCFTVHGRVRAFSANATCLDAYAPYESALPGLRERVRTHDAEVITRGDAAWREEQSSSMSVERAIVDRRLDAPWAPDVLPAWELERSWLAPGLAPVMGTR